MLGTTQTSLTWILLGKLGHFFPILFSYLKAGYQLYIDEDKIRIVDGKGTWSNTGLG